MTQAQPNARMNPTTHGTMVFYEIIRLWTLAAVLLLTEFSHTACSLAESSSANVSDDDDICLHVSMTMVLKDCAHGPHELAAVMHQDLVDVFGEYRYMCYSLDYGYLTYSDLREYALLYVDGGGGDWDTVADWFTPDLRREFVRRGHVVWFNADPGLRETLHDGQAWESILYHSHLASGGGIHSDATASTPALARRDDDHLYVSTLTPSQLRRLRPAWLRLLCGLTQRHERKRSAAELRDVLLSSSPSSSPSPPLDDPEL